MTVFIELSTLTDGSAFGRKEIPGTAADYYTPVDESDRLDFYWRAITDATNLESKRAFWNQYALIRNSLIVKDDWRDVVSDALLISRNLNQCRLWCAAGGNGALWLNAGTLHNASGTTDEWLSRMALEALCN